MPRGYTVATAALALDLPVKWIDNVLSHYIIPGVVQQRQGVSRKLSIEGLLIVAVTAFLIREINTPMSSAIAIARTLAENEGQYESREGLELFLDMPAFRTSLLARLEVAVETAPAPRRGRPPGNKTGRLD